MKRYIKYIISIFSLSCIASCSINDEIANPNDGGHMSLRLVSSTMTRATIPGNGVDKGVNDNNRNEDKLVSADLYFYASSGKAGNENAKWHTHVDMDASDSTGISNLSLPANVMQSVFGNGNSGYLYVIANYPSTATALPTYTSGSTEIANSSIDELKMYEVTAQWGPNSTTDDCVQSSFVMDGANNITKSANNVEGTIYLTRAAAKIELTITGFNGLPEGGVEDGEGNKWLPDFTTDAQGATSIGAFVKLQNAVANSYVGAPMAAGSYEYDETTATDGFYGYSTRADDGSYSQLIPFYSYSSDWSATGGANRASLLLVVPWKKVGTNVGQNCFYEIPIGARDNNLIERNKHYKVGVNVGTLGSFSPSEKVTITPAYITVVDWSTGQIDVNIAEAKYLVVDKTEIEIFNQTDCAISYASSHPVTATIDSIVFNSYKLANTRKIKITSTTKTITPSATNLSIADVYTDYDLSYGTTVTEAQSITTLPKGNATFGFTHAIPTYYTPRTIYVTVQHTADESFSEQVKIIQYPPIYFVGEKATGRVYVNEQYTEDDDRIYVYDDDRNGIGSIRDPSTVVSDDDATNMNENNYDIHVTVLPSGSKWQIGDPRETTGTTLTGINELTKYRKTRTDAVNVIAPVFKIASSRGKTTDMSFTNAIKRCASYQENGFPAGRWRVPTPAEIEFIVSRSADDDIPSLFDGEYWAANGQYFDSDDKQLHTTSNNQAVRCVYDVWYWGSDKIQGALNTPVWGDAKDNATLNAENPAN